MFSHSGKCAYLVNFAFKGLAAILQVIN